MIMIDIFECSAIILIDTVTFMQMKKLLLAMGSDILMDEAVSILIAKDLNRSFPDFELQIRPAGGIELIGLLSGYDLAVIIDTYMATQAEPGEIRVYHDFHDAKTLHLQNPHDVGFLDSLILADQLDYQLPDRIILLGISIRQQMVASRVLSDEIKKKYSTLLDQARGFIRQTFQ